MIYKLRLVCLVMVTVLSASISSAGTLFQENFDGLSGSLQPAVEEPGAAPDLLGWTHTPPAGWTNDDSNMPGVGDIGNDGRTEWAGWSFATRDFWLAADGQDREQFTNASGVFAIADPDEWDDDTHAEGWFNAFLSTPAISLGGAEAGTAQLAFDSSWRPEWDSNYHQTATISVSYDGGDPIEVMRWDGNNAGTNFHGDATNEAVFVDLDNPGGASDMVITFGMTDAGNDWWWAVDNIEVTAVPEPSTVILSLFGAIGIVAMLRTRRRRS